MSSMPMAMATNTRAVPRSGWTMISPVGTAMRAARPGGDGRARVAPGRPTAATAKITATLANSAGCNWKGPIWNQAWVPHLLPQRRDHQGQRHEHADVGQPGEVAQAAVVDQGDRHHADHADDDEQDLLAQERGVVAVGIGAPRRGQDHPTPSTETAPARHQHQVDVLPGRRARWRNARSRRGAAAGGSAAARSARGRGCGRGRGCPAPSVVRSARCRRSGPPPRPPAGRRGPRAGAALCRTGPRTGPGPPAAAVAPKPDSSRNTDTW